MPSSFFRLYCNVRLNINFSLYFASDYSFFLIWARYFRGLAKTRVDPIICASKQRIMSIVLREA